MSADNIRAALLRVLSSIAPETNPAALDPRAALREELDLDSMDWLAFVQGVRRELGVEIPEQEYRNLRSLDDSVAWLQQRLPA